MTTSGECKKCRSTDTVKGRHICQPCRNAQYKSNLDSKRRFVSQYKLDAGCARCGFDACARALHFHHRDHTQKESTVSQLVRNRGLPDVMAEIAKCEVLCANCHSSEHCMQDCCNG